MGASLSTALGDRVHARRDVLDILRVDARHREAAVARAEDVVLRRERVHLLRVRLQLYAPCSGWGFGYRLTVGVTLRVRAIRWSLSHLHLYPICIYPPSICTPSARLLRCQPGEGGWRDR